MLVRIDKYIIGTGESLILPSLLINVLSEVPEVSSCINERPGNVLFQRWETQPGIFHITPGPINELHSSPRFSQNTSTPYWSVYRISLMIIIYRPSTRTVHLWGPSRVCRCQKNFCFKDTLIGGSDPSGKKDSPGVTSKQLTDWLTYPSIGDGNRWFVVLDPVYHTQKTPVFMRRTHGYSFNETERCIYKGSHVKNRIYGRWT